MSYIFICQLEEDILPKMLRHLLGIFIGIFYWHICLFFVVVLFLMKYFIPKIQNIISFAGVCVVAVCLLVFMGSQLV